jgi:RNA polymerase sigma-70 factor (ECF subfamily)
VGRSRDHDLFAKIIDRPELYKQGYEVKPWLFRIAANMCKNAYRKRSFENAYREQLEEHQISTPTIELKIDEGIQSDMLCKALDRLDEDRKTMFLLRYQQDLSLKEIAVIFDLPEGTVKSRIFYIKKLLTGVIEEDENVLKDGK